MRRDIQLLRGIAVLLVVFFHANSTIFKNGFLGVDVFFVVSGFLITKIILEDLSGQSFSFLDFYLRRAKRLLPALYSTLLFTSVVAFFFLNPAQWEKFEAQLLGAISFSANLVLPTQIGYFEDAAETLPLLHIWSLSLEEQYYFFLPLFLFLLKERLHFIGLILVFLFSLTWCFYWASSSGNPPFLWRLGDSGINEWAFYLFPTRAWELLAGSICAWLTHRSIISHIPASTKWGALGVILFISIWGIDNVHPRIDALIVVICTSFIVLGKDSWLPKSRLSGWIENIGDWSYSVYLVHWPLFVFVNIAFLEQVPNLINHGLIIASLALGYLQYRYVETPFRYHWKKPNKTIWKKFGIATAGLLVFPVISWGTSPNTMLIYNKIVEIRKVNYGLNENCEGSFRNGNLHSDCLTDNSPEVAVWGDSYAMHLVPGIYLRNAKLAQLTKSVCGPILGLAPITEKYNKDWATKCILHNDQSLRYILNTDTISHVILSSTFSQYFKNDQSQFLIGKNIVNANNAIAKEYLINTITRLKNAGKTPIIISPPPRSGFNIGDCLEREDLELIVLRSDCEVNLHDSLAFDNQINRALEGISQEAQTNVIWLRDFLCEDEVCRTKINETYIYRDGGHLSISGSELLFNDFSLTN